MKSASKSAAKGGNGQAKSGKGGEQGLEKLLKDQLQDAYYFEKKLVKALGKMAKKATNEDLRNGFLQHQQETEGQVQRLEEIFEMLGERPKAKRCPAMDGLVEEAEEIMDEFSDDAALDAGLVCAAQKVEHYEIATYGSMVAWAQQLGHEDVAEALTATLEEEKACDEQLTEVAEAVVNIEAEEDEEEGEEEEETAGTKQDARGGSAKKNAATKGARGGSR